MVPINAFNWYSFDNRDQLNNPSFYYQSIIINCLNDQLTIYEGMILIIKQFLHLMASNRGLKTIYHWLHHNPQHNRKIPHLLVRIIFMIIPLALIILFRLILLVTSNRCLQVQFFTKILPYQYSRFIQDTFIW